MTKAYRAKQELYQYGYIFVHILSSRNIMKKVYIFILSIMLLIFNVNAVLAKGKRPKVSIIIPVYNTERYLPQCLDSIINQTLRELEIICVNDGSSDNSLSILNNYRNKDNRIKIINKGNRGVSAARNEGIKAARGEYITFVDSDDYVDLSTYEVLYEYAKKDDIDIIQMGIRRFKDGEDNYDMALDFADAPVISARKFLRANLSNYVWDKLYKSNVIKGRKPIKFINEISLAEDTCFSYMTLSRSRKFKRIDAKLYNYRNRPNSLSKLSCEEKFLEGSKMFKYIINDWKACGYIRKNKDFLLDILLRWIFCYKTVCAKYADKIFNDLSPYINDKRVISRLPKIRQNQIKILKDALQSEQEQDNQRCDYE